MAEIKSVDRIVEKWTRVTPQRRQDYAAGVRRPLRDWQTEAAAAEARYTEAVTQAAQAGRFGQGVARAGTQKWQRKATTVGEARWGPGVTAAAQDYQEGFRPFADVIAATQLPQKFPTGDPRNFERVRAIGEALHAAKVGAR